MTERSRHDASGSAIERIYAEWDDALGAKDAEAAVALYHPDATLESPLIAAHRVYWGWPGVGMLRRGEHGR
jgi:ketosteroid isomerase-like protein